MGKIDLKKWEEISNKDEEKITLKKILWYFIIYSINIFTTIT